MCELLISNTRAILILLQICQMFMINKFGQVKWQCMPMFYVGSKCPFVWGECLSYTIHSVMQFYTRTSNSSNSMEMFSVYKLASKQNFFYEKKKNTLVHLLLYYHSQYAVQLTIVGTTCNISSTPQIIATSVGTTDSSNEYHGKLNIPGVHGLPS